MKYQSTGMKIIDDLLGGGLPVGHLSGLHSLPNLGKSLFSLQCAYQFLADNPDKKAIILETEGMPLEAGMEMFRKRFKTNRDPEIRRCVGLDKLLNVFGYSVVYNYSDRGKIEGLGVFKIPAKEQKSKGVIKDWSQYGYLSVDSFTEPIKQMMLSQTKNLPARSDLETFLCGILQNLAETHQMVVFTTHHTSKDPTNYMDMGTVSGGTALQYQVKFLFQLLPPDKSIRGIWGEEARRVVARRVPFKTVDPQRKEVVLLKKDFGFTDPK